MSSETTASTMEHEATNSLVPKLRFPEFLGADEWKPISLQEASTPVTERVGERKLTPVSISAGIGFVPQAVKFGRDISGKQYQLYTLVRDGDFVFNKGNSLQFPQGCVYQLQRWGQVAAPNVFICFRLKKGYSGGFFQQCFEQNQHGKQLRRHITSSARSNGLLNISKETFFSVEIPTPSLAEQQRIADCLRSLDELIAVQARKVKALKTHKRGLMQRLFPCEGEAQPRLRFPEFQNAGEWEATTLGEYFCPIRNGFVGTATPYYTSSGGVPYLQGKNVKNGRIDASNLVFITPEFHVQQKKSHLKTGDILMVQSGHVGECAVVGADYEGCNCHALVILSPSRRLDSEFFVHYFYAPIGELAIFQITTGNTIKHILASELKTLPVLVPKPAEQQRIASCISKLDALTVAENQKLEALKTHKKGLMQKLFPALGLDEP
jgi:type I restriction enzyme S subunit